jgi:O-antigen ligase
MFSTELNSEQNSLLSRTWGIVLGSLLMVAVAAALVSARTVPFMFGLTLAAFVLASFARGTAAHALPRANPIVWHLLIFFVYCAVSAAWSADPPTAFGIVLIALAFCLGAIALIQFCEVETRPNVVHIAEGVWVGFAAALAYLFVETVTNQSIKIMLYNAIGMREGQLAPAMYFQWSEDHKLVSIMRDDLARSVAALTLCLGPALLAMRGTMRRPWSLILQGAALVGAAVVIMHSTHATSKMAFIGGAATFLLACLSAKAAARVVAVAWVIACLGILPGALLAYRYDLHNSPMLVDTARHRIIIWNFTAQEVLKAPWLGVGARTTYVMGPRLEPEIVTRPGEAFRRTLSTHSHSVYLQTWFELGLIGATLLTLLGLSMLQGIRTLRADLQPYGYAIFAGAALMAASSYGMWQIWFVGLFAMCAALFGVGITAMRTRPAG